MGLRDMIRAIREYPAARAKLDMARSELRQVQQALERSAQECERLEADKSNIFTRLRFSEKKTAALQSVLEAFCPKQASLEGMKQLYAAISPSLDPSGFTLYRAAKKLTGIDIHTFFPYEDNRGMFEAMDGRQLLNCLTAARFGAVEWKVVEGTGHEKAVFREVDTSTPEYQAFEKQLYTKVLERMGFQDMLAPDQVTIFESKVTELKLYSPLSAELEGEASVQDWVDEPDPPEPPPLTGEDLSAPALRAAILKGIEDEQAPEGSGRGLMIYFDGSDAVNEKVISFFPSVEEVDGWLYGVAVCQVRGELSPSELEELKEYCLCQYADGWGKGFAQRPRHTEYGDLYVSFYIDNSTYILTKAELETARAPSHAPHQPERGGGAR